MQSAGSTCMTNRPSPMEGCLKPTTPRSPGTTRGRMVERDCASPRRHGDGRCSSTSAVGPAHSPASQPHPRKRSPALLPTPIVVGGWVHGGHRVSRSSPSRPFCARPHARHPAALLQTRPPPPQASRQPDTPLRSTRRRHPRQALVRRTRSFCSRNAGPHRATGAKALRSTQRPQPTPPCERSPLPPACASSRSPHRR